MAITQQDIEDRYERICVPILYANVEGVIYLDEDGIREEFEARLKELKEL